MGDVDIMKSIDLFPVVEPDEKDENMLAWGVVRKRYIVLPADYDGSVDAYNEWDDPIATSDDLDMIRQFVKAVREVSVFDIDDYLIYDTETDEFVE